jgi:hypothetical protein
MMIKVALHLGSQAWAELDRTINLFLTCVYLFPWCSRMANSKPTRVPWESQADASPFSSFRQPDGPMGPLYASSNPEYLSASDGEYCALLCGWSECYLQLPSES